MLLVLVLELQHVLLVQLVGGGGRLRVTYSLGPHHRLSHATQSK
jgi:hypothetical protein